MQEEQLMSLHNSIELFMYLGYGVCSILLCRTDSIWAIVCWKRLTDLLFGLRLDCKNNQTFSIYCNSNFSNLSFFLTFTMLYIIASTMYASIWSVCLFVVNNNNNLSETVCCMWLVYSSENWPVHLGYCKTKIFSLHMVHSDENHCVFGYCSLYNYIIYGYII